MAELLPSMQLTPTSKERASASPSIEHSEDSMSLYARHGQAKLTKSALSMLMQTAVVQLTCCTMKGLMSSEKLSISLIATKNTDWFAAQFSKVIPESYADENLQIATTIVSGNQRDQRVTLLKMLVYLASNNFLLTETSVRTGQLVPAAGAIVTLFRVSGLGSPRILRQLVKLSLESLTIMAMVEVLFNAVILVEAVDIVSALLSRDSRISLSGKIQCTMWLERSRWPPLHWVIINGSIDLARVIIAAGADIHQNAHMFSTLILASCHSDHTISSQLTQLILENGVSVNTSIEGGPSALQMCLSRGNIKLARHLISLGADVMCTCFGWAKSWREQQSRQSDTMNCLLGLIPFRNPKKIGTLAFAASANTLIPEDSRYHQLSDIQGYVNRNATSSDEEDVINLTKILLARVSIGGTIYSDAAAAMVVAASRGHSRVLSFFRQQLGLPIDSVYGLLSPLYAAILFDQTSVCQQLLQWGASPSEDDRLRVVWESDWDGLPAPLHLAVLNNSCEQVELLIHYGADANMPCKLHNTRVQLPRWMRYSFSTWSWKSEVFDGDYDQSTMSYESPDFLPCWLYTVRRIILSDLWDSIEHEEQTMSPLLTAVVLGHWEVALTLLDMGATATGDILTLVSSCGQNVLVEKLLQGHLHPNKCNRRGVTALEIAVANGHNRTVHLLLRAGATVNKLSLAQIFSLSDIALVNLLLDSMLISTPPPLRDHERSYLEYAILCGKQDILNRAFSLYPTYYDSGSLCAAVRHDIQSSSPCCRNLTQTLVEKREDFTENDDFIDLMLENTAISIAAFHGRIDLVTIMLRTRIEAYCQNYGPGFYQLKGPVTKISKWDGWHDVRDSKECPIYFAIESGNDRLVDTLLDAGYKANGRTISAAIKSRHKGHRAERLVKSYLKWRVLELHLDLHWDDQRVGLPLHIAVQEEDPTWINLLLAANEDVNATSRAAPGRLLMTPLGRAAHVGNLDLVLLLLQNGANIDIGPKDGNSGATALQIAVAEGHINVVQLLLTHGADAHAQRYPEYCGYFILSPGLFSGTAIELAAGFGRLDILHVLLDHGLSTEGYHRVQYVLALHYAQKLGHSAIVQCLLDHRPWSFEDEEILQELTDYPPEGCLFFHPKEYPEDEFAHTVMDMCTKHRLLEYPPDSPPRKWWKDKPLCHDRWHADSYSDSTSECSSNSADSANIALGEKTEETQTIDEAISSLQAQEIDPDLPGVLLVEEYQLDKSDCDARFMTANPGPKDGARTVEILDGAMGDAVADKSAIGALGQAGNTLVNMNEANERRQQILDDMMGLTEAPFGTSEWLW